MANPESSIPPVYLISANAPGCGSTTLANEVVGALELGMPHDAPAPHTVFVGALLRERLGARTEVEMKAKLSQIDDPRVFDEQFYGNLPQDRPCVIEGKLATTVGPSFINPAERPVVAVNLIASPILSAKRITQRESGVTSNLYSETTLEAFLSNLRNSQQRAAHDNSMRKLVAEQGTDRHWGIRNVAIDTGRLSVREALSLILEDAPLDQDKVYEWELQALEGTLQTLHQLGVAHRNSIGVRDKRHFDHQREAIEYGIDRLRINHHPLAIAGLREDLRKAITDCWYGLMLKQIPRFYTSTMVAESSAEEEILLDADSYKWSPDFYKIAEGWPALSSLLKDKTVLDPFAGAGMLINLLAARNIPKEIIASDISYAGGSGVNGTECIYLPQLNMQASKMLFDALPSWYRPEMDSIKGYVTADARRLPFKEDGVDYVLADPPYGKNLSSGGVGLLIGSLHEFRRVAKEGVILLLPVGWINEIEQSGIEIQLLTDDVSDGNSGYPVCYALIRTTKAEKAERCYQTSLPL